MTLKNKIVLITGASSGIGEACAKTFAKAGANLILTARRKDRLDNLKKDIQTECNINICNIQLDVRSYEDVEKQLDTLPNEFRNVDILINNAGKALGIEKIQDGLIENWEEMIDTNIKGLLYITRVVVPKMIERGIGHIINIGSIAGHEVYIGGNVYCASKYAVKALSKGMLLDLNGTGIRVTSIDPGMVETEFSIVRFKGNSKKASDVYKGFEPLTGENIADIVLFAATRPSNVTLQTIVVTPTNQASVNVISRK